MKANENLLKKYEIMKALSCIPPDRLDEVDTFIKFILFQSKINISNKKREPKTLSGIWANKGFEKIANIDEEIIKLRHELGNQILERNK